MAYEIFDVKKENAGKIDELLKDDQVSRQSIIVKDAAVFDLKDHGMLVFIEGSQGALDRAKELFSPIGKPLEGKDKETAYQKFKDEENAVLGGAGIIFG